LFAIDPEHFEDALAVELVRRKAPAEITAARVLAAFEAATSTAHRRRSSPTSGSASTAGSPEPRAVAVAAGRRRATLRGMDRIQEVFGVPRVLLPVIHPIGWDEALAAVRIAVDAGVRGVFLIDQGMPTDEVLELILRVRNRHPALWVGVNLLACTPAEALATALDKCGRIDGIWSDNAGIDETAAEQPRAQAFVEARRARAWNGLLFGGVAFKYQREVPAERLGAAAAAARPFMDVVCTSGPGTGQEADVAKIRALKEGLGGDGALALASGVTSENVANYLPFVSAYLVGTGIEQSFGVLDPDRVRALHARIAGATS
jgi:predicted TIM-barrel enzyme